MYQKEVEVRWNDLDANGHMANAAYVQMGSTTRMVFFDSLGFSLEKMQQKRIGPIVFQEQLFYFQEGFLGDRIRITVQLSGLSEAGRFFATQQEFYDKEGNNLARILLTGVFLIQKQEKLLPWMRQIIKIKSSTEDCCLPSSYLQGYPFFGANSLSLGIPLERH